MAISAPGIGSGVDIQNIVPDLVAAEREPTLNRLARKEATLQAELSAVGILKSSLSEFQSKLSGLKDSESFSNRTASSSDSAIASFSAEKDAAAGSYSLEVTSLATAQKLVSLQEYDAAGFTPAEGTITFKNVDESESFTVTLDTDNNASTEAIRDAINNADDNFGITVTILVVGEEKRLVFNTDDTGTNANLTISTITDNAGAGADLSIFENGISNYDTVTSAADAVFSIDGQSMTSASNTIEGVIPDATITLKDSNIGEPITLSISKNNSAIKGQITAMVEGYNELIALINEQTSYNSETETSGTLFGDSLINRIENQLRSALTNQISGNNNGYTSLTSIGITTTSDGTFEIDNTKLETALSDDYAGITTLFSDDPNGIAFKVDTILDNYLKFDGTISGRTDSINAKLENITDDRIALDLRSQKLEARLFKQFNAMDLLVAQLNSTGQWLTSALDNLPGVVRESK